MADDEAPEQEQTQEPRQEGEPNSPAADKHPGEGTGIPGYDPAFTHDNRTSGGSPYDKNRYSNPNVLGAPQIPTEDDVNDGADVPEDEAASGSMSTRANAPVAKAGRGRKAKAGGGRKAKAKSTAKVSRKTPTTRVRATTTRTTARKAAPKAKAAPKVKVKVKAKTTTKAKAKAKTTRRR